MSASRPIDRHVSDTLVYIIEADTLSAEVTVEISTRKVSQVPPDYSETKVNRYCGFESLVSWKALRKIGPNKGAADRESLGRKRPRGSRNRRALFNADRKSEQSQDAAAGQLRLCKVGLGRPVWRGRWTDKVCL